MLQRFVHQFVNRHAEIEQLEQPITQLSQGDVVKECVINICGVAGVGKSALLAEIYERYFNNPATSTICIDISIELSQPDLRMAKIRFLKALREYDNLANDIGFTRLTDTSSNTEIEAELVRLVGWLSNLAKPLVLILDSWQHALDGLDAWVERTLLLPLIRREHVVCFLGSQRPMQLRQFEVRRRTNRLELDALDLAATQQIAGADVALGQAVYSISFGHPAATKHILDQLEGHDRWLEWIEANRTTLLERAIDTIYAGIPHPIESFLRWLLERLAVLRRFDITLLQATLPQLVTNSHLTQTNLLSYLASLREAALVHWQSENNSYQVDHTVRQILIQVVSLAHPCQVTILHTITADYYEKLLQTDSPQWFEYLLEYCYHFLQQHPVRQEESARIESHWRNIIYRRWHGELTIDANVLEDLQSTISADSEIQKLLLGRGLEPMLLFNIIKGTISPEVSQKPNNTSKQA